MTDVTLVTPEILKREIERAVRTLTTAQQYGYGFAVHSPMDGLKFGNLEAHAPKPPKKAATRHNIHKPGELKLVYEPFLKDIKAGELAVFPAGPYKAEAIRAAASSYCTILWGRGSYTSYVDSKANTVQIMRVS